MAKSSPKSRPAKQELKSQAKRGDYLQPERYNQPIEKSLFWTINPELLKQFQDLLKATLVNDAR